MNFKDEILIQRRLRQKLTQASGEPGGYFRQKCRILLFALRYYRTFQRPGPLGISMSTTTYCPRCASEFTPDTSFCRTCGLELDGVRAIVTGEASTAPDLRSRPNFKMMRIGVGLFILGLVIGLLNGALRGFDWFPQQYGKLVFLLCAAAGMLCLGAGFVFPRKYYVKKDRKDGVKGNNLAGPSTGKLDQLSPANTDADLNRPMSVTERTTRNLR